MGTPDINRLFPDVDPKTFSFLPVLDQFYEGVVVTDNQGIILYMNETQAKIDGLKPSDVVGKNVTEVYRVDDGVKREAVLKRFVTGMPTPYDVAGDNPGLSAVVIDADDATGQANSIERILMTDEAGLSV